MKTSSQMNNVTSTQFIYTIIINQT